LWECAGAGVQVAVLLAVGFGEAGEEGRALEAELRDVVAQTGIRLVGPNTSGVLCPGSHLNLIGVPDVTSGPIGLVMQSGNLALHLVRSAAAHGSGISACVGVGNQVDLGFHDYFDVLSAHEPTRVIVAYVEGVRDGSAFLHAAGRAARIKPVVVLKGARSLAGQSAALSHTGAIAGAYGPFASAMRELGVTVVEREDELLPTALALCDQPPRPQGIAVLSDGGGQGTLVSDALFDLKAPTAMLSPQTRTVLRSLLGPNAAVANPVDLAGSADADPMMFAQAAQHILADPDVGTLLVVGLFGGYHQRFASTLLKAETDAAQALVAAARETGKALVMHTMYAQSRSVPLDRLRAAGVGVTASLEAAARAAAELRIRGRALAGPAHPILEASHPSPVMSESITAYGEWETMQALAPLNLPFAKTVFCAEPSEVGHAARTLGRVVIKAVVPGLVHKTDVGAVRVDVAPEDAEAVAAAMSQALRVEAGAPLAGFLVQELLPESIVELVVSVHRDPNLGLSVTVGSGGTWVEIASDLSHRLIPLAPHAVQEMLESLKVFPLLAGARGRASADLEATESFIDRLASYVEADPQIVEIEINPLFVYSEGVVAADAMMTRAGA